MTAAGPNGATGSTCRGRASARASPTAAGLARVRATPCAAPSRIALDALPRIDRPMRREDLRSAAVECDEWRRRARLAQRVRPVGRIGDRHEPAGELSQGLAEAAIGGEVDLAGDLERRNGDER